MALIKRSKGVRKGSLNLFVATPTYSGKLDSRYLHSMIQSLDLLEKENIGFELFTLSYHCHVDDARNTIVAEFLASECDELIFIDADVSWIPSDLVRLAKYDRDLVAGVYPKRSKHDLDFPVTVAPGVELRADQDGLVEVDGAPTGFMKIRRAVLEQFQALNKDRQFKSRNAGPDDPVNTIIFERTWENGERFSGDLAFCRNWKKLGGKVYVDPYMKLSHTGEVDFEGTLADHWLEKYGQKHVIAEKRFNRAVRNLKNGQCDENDIQDLIYGWGGNPYAAPADLLATCFMLAKESEGHVIETGSGLSTIVMALANPDLTIHCLEHDMLWASKLKYAMQIHDITNIEIHYGPLKTYPKGQWYDLTLIPNIEFSIALCDGPPRKISNRSIFYDFLNARIQNAVVLMDDADDDKAV